MTDRYRNRRDVLLAAGAAGLSTLGATTAFAQPGAGFTQTLPGAVARPLQDKLGEVLSARDFGAVGDGTVDDTAALQAWLNAGLAGRTIYLPKGKYRVSRTLSGRVRDDGLGGYRLGIFGDGAANTEILYVGDKDRPALSLLGNMPVFDHLVLRGLRIALPDGGAPGLGRGAAFRFENFRNFEILDIRTVRAGIGVEMIGCLVGRVCSYLSFYDRKGMALSRGNYLSTPNAISLELCSILAAYEVGIELTSPSLVRIGNGSTIEGIGVENLQGDTTGLLVTDPGYAGGIGVVADGIYFEGNRGCDVRLRQHDTTAAYSFAGCTFNRVHHDTRHGVLFEALHPEARALIDVRGAAFMGYGADYVPSAERRYVAFNLPAAYRGLTFLDDGAIYHHAIERPVVPAAVVHPGMVGMAGLVHGDGRVVRSRGIESATWVSPGYCVLRLTAGVENPVVNLTPYGTRALDLRVAEDSEGTLAVEAVDPATRRRTTGSFMISGVYS